MGFRSCLWFDRIGILSHEAVGWDSDPVCGSTGLESYPTRRWDGIPILSVVRQDRNPIPRSGGMGFRSCLWFDRIGILSHEKNQPVEWRMPMKTSTMARPEQINAHFDWR